MAVKLAIGDIVDGGPGTSHQQGAEREYQQLPNIGKAVRRLNECRPAWEKREPYPDGTIQPRQTRVGSPCSGKPALHPVVEVDIAQIRAACSGHLVQTPNPEGPATKWA